MLTMKYGLGRAGKQGRAGAWDSEVVTRPISLR